MSTEKSFLSFVVLLLLCLPFGSTAPSRPTASSDNIYYLSLGDSFAAGVKPIAPNETITPAYSYADALYELLLLKKDYNNLKLIKYGCSGATSDDIVSLDKCNQENPKYSQLDQVINFMKSNRGLVKFVTINIGVNDFHRYRNDKDIDGCFSKILKNISNNLTDIIIPKLKEAGGEGVRYAASTYFQRSTNDLDDLLVKIYSENGFRVADIRSVFGTNGDPAEFKRRVCLYTNSCNKHNNSHPNVEGSRAIGSEYDKELGPFD
ncbi:3633_t:CDS:1 [Ambispora gerdemannii]|uniref:3633_t:CDS:1 n=1 Tax=Ambispora gerdemannii TaxID=144530 RepID=A0A9N9DVU9_9GLOM|nr:3633_t:CDS:1 [Ambispora gerdemannii]